MHGEGEKEKKEKKEKTKIIKMINQFICSSSSIYIVNYQLLSCTEKSENKSNNPYKVVGLC